MAILARTEITGLLLMGGRSRRMGTDKAKIIWKAEPLWERQLRLLATVADPVWRSLPFGTPSAPDTVVDPVPYPGPATAIALALAAMKTAWLLVLAVDLPHVNADLLESLIAQRRHEGIAVVADAHHLQPLCSIWHQRVRERLPESLVDISMQQLLQSIPTTVYQIPDDQPSLLLNLNRPSDLGDHSQ